MEILHCKSDRLELMTAQLVSLAAAVADPPGGWTDHLMVCMIIYNLDSHAFHLPSPERETDATPGYTLQSKEI